eukprot:5616679-Lingulodinium_polyedra.AAC.1
MSRASASRLRTASRMAGPWDRTKSFHADRAAKPRVAEELDTVCDGSPVSPAARTAKGPRGTADRAC